MRYLTVVRHAKASPAALGASDFERVLDPTGVRQCDELHAWASDSGALGAYGPVTALVSSSARTRETFDRAFGSTPLIASVMFSDALYNGRRDVSPDDVVAELSVIDPGSGSLLVVAHNPTVHELLVFLTGRTPKSLDNYGYPLGGAYVLELRDDQPISHGSCQSVAEFIPGSL